jgi:hypothetical protein
MTVALPIVIAAAAITAVLALVILLIEHGWYR